MIYPERLKENDIIGITAPSNGLLKDAKIIALEKAIANLNKYGFRVCESDNVRKSINGASSNAQHRAKSFMEYITYAKCFGYYIMFCVRNRHIIYCSKVYFAQIQSI